MADRAVDRLGWGMAAVAAVMLLAAAATVSYLAWRVMDLALIPELERKGETLGRSITLMVDRGLAAGIPLDGLVGVDTVFERELAAHPDIAYLALVDGNGNALVHRGVDVPDGIRPGGEAGVGPAAGEWRVLSGYQDFMIPLAADGAALHVGIEADLIDDMARDVLFDVLSVLAVACVLAVELILLAIGRTSARLRAIHALADRAAAGDLSGAVGVGGRDSVGRLAAWCDGVLAAVGRAHQGLVEKVAQARERVAGDDGMLDRLSRLLAEVEGRYGLDSGGDGKAEGGAGGRVADPASVRLLIFIVAFAEELSRPFFPLYVRAVAAPTPWLSEDMAIALPMMMFIIVWAVSQFPGAVWSDRIGRRPVFAAGALAAAAGFTLTAFAGGLAELIAYRSLTAVGYGLVLISCQGMIIDGTTAGTRATGMATLVGGLLAAGVCGPALGGVIAAHIGQSSTFLVAAALALTALVLAMAVLPADRRTVTRGGGRGSWRQGVKLLRSAPFLSLMAFSAIPTKLAATALLFYLLPLMLAGDGATTADIGRVQLLYFLAFIVAAPVVARASDRLGWRRAFLAAGGFGTTIAVLPLLLPGGVWTAAACALLFGMAQSLISAPQLALVVETARRLDPGVSEGVVVATFRFIERLGSIVAPALGAALAMMMSYREASVGIGVLIGAAALLLLVTFRAASASTSKPRPVLEETP